MKLKKNTPERKAWSAPQLVSLDDDMSEVRAGLGTAPEGPIASSATS